MSLLVAGCLPSGSPQAPEPDGGVSDLAVADLRLAEARDLASSHADLATVDLSMAGDMAYLGCIPKVAANGDGHHNPGTACLGCHNGGAPRFSVAGTVKTAGSGGTPVAGATVEVTDSKNQVARMVTGSNGNFYSTNNALVGPFSIRVSGCPSDTYMSATGGGDCNSCHNASKQIFLLP